MHSGELSTPSTNWLDTYGFIPTPFASLIFSPGSVPPGVEGGAARFVNVANSDPLFW